MASGFGRGALLASVAIVCVADAGPAWAQSKNFEVPAQAAASGISELGRQADIQIVAARRFTQAKKTNAVRGVMTIDRALDVLLDGTGLIARRTGTQTFTIVPPVSDAPKAQPIAGSAVQAVQEPRAPAYDEIIVTAQKKEERITDVPIAMSAFSAEALDDYKIEGGSELLRAIPNVSFSKTNFSMYNFSIRGVGTHAVSASSDPAVAVSFNSTPLIRNRLFEAEFFDVGRIEVLRGPQGTLYGRNATAGVVNVIPAMPTDEFAGELKGEVGSYETRRLSAMLNVPITSELSFRLSGAMTKRDGFDYNTYNQRRVNGRDLWSTRAIVAWEPSDSFKASAIWQHFEEDDDRARTGKQLCTNDPGPSQIGEVVITNPLHRARLSQGCLPGSLYDDEAFGAPNGASLTYMFVPSQMLTIGQSRIPGLPRQILYAVNTNDPFAGLKQSRNLREISTSYDPKFRANNNFFQLNLEFDFDKSVSVVSQTSYAEDNYYSTQDYNRFSTGDIFNDSSQPYLYKGTRLINSELYPGATPGGIFCDPQLGCSKGMVSADLSTSRSRQWTQEFRVQSNFDGPSNFLLGANYLNFKSQDNYYVFNNLFTLIGNWFYAQDPLPPGMSPRPCDLGFEGYECIYVDPNPIDKVNNKGHNYFLSQNGVKIDSWGLFGEYYLDLASNVGLILGARYTKDKKVADQVPSQLLLGGGQDTPFPGNVTGGSVNSGYPRLDDISQSWGRFTGRAVLNWKPDLKFSEDSLVYASLSRGYKGGGVNPPRVDFNPDVVQYQFLPQTFKPEYVNSLEIGTKLAFNGGRFTLNATAFYYDYKDYQVSQIVDRIAYNENFDATSMGLEFEGVWRPVRAVRFDANLGYLRTRIAAGSQSIDVMNRTQGNEDWVVLRPWLQVPSNCIAPKAIVELILENPVSIENALASLCPGSNRAGRWDPAVPGTGSLFYETYGVIYNPLAPYDPDGMEIVDGRFVSGAPNGGRGFSADLEGNELPNAPRFTLNFGAQYTIDLDHGQWELTLRGDYYHQSKSFGRVYNTEFDRLRAWGNVNLSATLGQVSKDFSLQLYVKNLLNKSPITGFFVNSDDTGLTTNVFIPDPRIIGLSAKVSF